MNLNFQFSLFSSHFFRSAGELSIAGRRGTIADRLMGKDKDKSMDMNKDKNLAVIAKRKKLLLPMCTAFSIILAVAAIICIVLGELLSKGESGPITAAIVLFAFALVILIWGLTDLLKGRKTLITYDLDKKELLVLKWKRSFLQTSRMNFTQDSEHYIVPIKDVKEASGNVETNKDAAWLIVLFGAIGLLIGALIYASTNPIVNSLVIKTSDSAVTVNNVSSLDLTADYILNIRDEALGKKTAA